MHVVSASLSSIWGRRAHVSKFRNFFALDTVKLHGSRGLPQHLGCAECLFFCGVLWCAVVLLVYRVDTVTYEGCILLRDLFSVVSQGCA